jgi:DNA invertase Pin-like site-specific DNA recombinase
MEKRPAFVAYYRVSTRRQAASGLGLEAQARAVAQFVEARGGALAAAFTEAESGKADRRPELAKAVAQAQALGAQLLIAKLDRLSRNASFIMALRDAQVDFCCCDMPEANTLTIGIMAVMAQHEREATSQRTRQALQAKKARMARGDYRNARPGPDGQPAFLKPDRLGRYRLGNPQGFPEAVSRMGREAWRRKARAAEARIHAQRYIAKNMHLTIRQLAHDLRELGFRTARGKPWASSSVWMLKKELQEGSAQGQ